MISEERLRDLLRADGSLDEAAQRLVEAANEAGGKDNITVVLFRLGDDGGATAVSGDTLSGQETRADLSTSEVRAAAEADRASKSRTAAAGSSRSRGRRRIGAALAALVLAALLVGFYFGSREFYFLGTNDQGLVSLYRGLPTTCRSGPSCTSSST